MINTIVTLYVLPGKTEEFEALHRQILETLAAHGGCVEIRVHRSLANPLEYLCWDRAHRTTEQFKSLFSSLPIERHTLSRASFFEPAYAFIAAAEHSGATS